MIFINGRFLFQAVTGVQRFGRELITELAKYRDDLVVVTPGGNFDFDIPSNVKHISYGKLKGHAWEQIELPIFLYKNKKPLLLNFCNTAPILYNKNIYTLHDIIFKYYPESYSFAFRTYYNSMCHVLLRRAVKIITVSDFSKMEIMKYYGVNDNKISVIHNSIPGEWVDSDVVKAAVPNKLVSGTKYVFSTLSSFDENKNLNNLVNAFKLIKNDNVELRLLGSHAGKNEKCLNDALLDDRIKYLGRVSDDELIQNYKESWAFIIPSNYEGFGIPPLEAQACSCPVLSARSSSLPEVLSNSALFFNQNDILDIKNKIEEVISDPNLRQNLVIQGLKNIKRFSFNRSASTLSKIIDGVRDV